MPSIPAVAAAAAAAAVVVMSELFLCRTAVN